MSSDNRQSGTGTDKKRKQYAKIDLSDPEASIPDITFTCQPDANGSAFVPDLSLNFTVKHAHVNRSVAPSYNQRTNEEAFKKEMRQRRELREAMMREIQAESTNDTGTNDKKRSGGPSLYNRDIKDESQLSYELQQMDKGERNKRMKNVYCKFFPYSDDPTTIRNTLKLCKEIGSSLFNAMVHNNLHGQRSGWQVFQDCLDFMFDFEFSELTDEASQKTYTNIRLREFIKQAAPKLENFTQGDKTNMKEFERAQKAFNNFREQLYQELFEGDEQTSEKWMQHIVRVHYGTDIVWNHDFHEEIDEKDFEPGNTTITERFQSPDGNEVDMSLTPREVNRNTYRKLAPYDLYPNSEVEVLAHFFRVFVGRQLSTRVIVNNVAVKKWGTKPESSIGASSKPIQSPDEIPDWMMQQLFARYSSSSSTSAGTKRKQPEDEQSSTTIQNGKKDHQNGEHEAFKHAKVSDNNTNNGSNDYETSEDTTKDARLETNLSDNHLPNVVTAESFMNYKDDTSINASTENGVHTTLESSDTKHPIEAAAEEGEAKVEAEAEAVDE